MNTIYNCGDCGRVIQITPLAKKGLIYKKEKLECPSCHSKKMIPRKHETNSNAPGYFKCFNGHYFKVSPVTMKHGGKLSCPKCDSDSIFGVRKKDYEMKGDADEIEIKETTHQDMLDIKGG